MPTDAARADRFDSLLREVVDPVRGYLARRTDAVTAADVLSETLVAVWRRIDDVPPDAAIAWSIGVARLQLRNAERSARRQERLVQRIAAIDPPVDHLPAADADDEVDDVRRTLAQLRRADAELLRLWVWDDLSPGQIATVLGVTPNAVSIRLHRAKRRFEELYRKLATDAGHAAVREGGER